MIHIIRFWQTAAKVSLSISVFSSKSKNQSLFDQEAIRENTTILQIRCRHWLLNCLILSLIFRALLCRLCQLFKVETNMRSKHIDQQPMFINSSVSCSDTYCNTITCRKSSKFVRMSIEIGRDPYFYIDNVKPNLITCFYNFPMQSKYQK